MPESVGGITEHERASSIGWLTRFLLGAMFLLGFLGRALPLLDPGRVFTQWATEDGYLTLTIARNLALGRGMTVSGGEVETNGTQPLATFVYALGFYAAGGDRWWGVLLAHVYQLVIFAVAAWLLWRLTRRVLAGSGLPGWVGPMAVAAWYAGGPLMGHAINGLETATYLAALLLSILIWHRWVLDGKPGITRPGPWVVGMCLGLAAWARIDAVLMILALTVWHGIYTLVSRRGALLTAFGESMVMGCTAAAVVSPWLISNKLRFDRFTPISGVAQSASATFGSNLPTVPAKLTEYATGVLLIPGSLENRVVVMACCWLFLAGVLVVTLASLRRMTAAARLFAGLGVMASVIYVGYYGLLFGAEHFVARYLAPLSIFLVLVTPLLLGGISLRLGRAGNLVPGFALVAAMIISAALYARAWRIGINNGHFQVVNWVQEHASEATWVGAVQTGTLGFFHERTRNLDGKVDPVSLGHLLNDTIPEYVADSNIEVLADWAGLSVWLKREPIATHFDLVVHDAERNLAVFVRKGHGLAAPAEIR
jgi:hypothetical protein